VVARVVVAGRRVDGVGDVAGGILDVVPVEVREAEREPDEGDRATGEPDVKCAAAIGRGRCGYLAGERRFASSQKPGVPVLDLFDGQAMLARGVRRGDIAAEDAEDERAAASGLPVAGFRGRGRR
jgi:hypothetical protein